MPALRPDYRIYPSLLDLFQSLLDYEIVVEEPWNRVNGEYKLTADEMYDKLDCELLDAVNRVPHDPSEAADKGTCFNEIVDCLIHHRPCTRSDMQIRSLRREGVAYGIEAEMNDFHFVFDVGLCTEASRYFKGAVSQVLLSAPINTPYGCVELYGYADEWVRDKIYDIKTTSYYNFGKFERKWQRHVYPYCAIESGMTDCVSEFEYTIYRLIKPSEYTNGIIFGEKYKEAYTYDHKASTAALRTICSRFIEWLRFKDAQGLITNRKIFNEQAS